MHYGMVIDTTRCFGCNACVTSCKMSNNNPVGMVYNRILTRKGMSDADLDAEMYMDTAAGTYPAALARVHVPLACQHCESPACVSVCPTGASSRNEETGIVEIDAEACIGCQSCMSACPYHVRTFSEGEPTYTLGFAVGEDDAPIHIANTVEKCTMCGNRITRGLVPKCVEACLGEARFWGDLDDPDSDVAKLVATRDAVRLLESAGTNPSVYYLK